MQQGATLGGGATGSFHRTASHAKDKGGAAAGAERSDLFDTPSELLCPITQDLLIDPVLTTSGQVYERAAIETHLARAAAVGTPLTDPLTNSPLDSDQLLPVFPMRSRAAEYRETTVRTCAQLAVSEPRRSEAVRYLRRASELALPPAARVAPPQPPALGRPASRPGSARGGGGAGGGNGGGGGDELLVPAPGLSPDLARFVVSHRGEAYQAVALKWFGNELLRSGFPDQAADVFYGLLLDECDRQQQADYLSLCLECWGHNAAGEPAGKAGAAGSQAAAVEADGAIITKLADFVERQHCMSAGDIVDMLAAPTALGRGGALWLCEALLARAAGGSASSDSHSRRGSAADGGAAGGSSAQLGGPRAIELMVRYVRLSSAAAAAAADSSQQAARQLQGVTPQVGGGSFKPRGGRAQRLRPAVSSPHARAVASGVLAAASLVGGGGFALRLARLLPLLMLLHTPARGRT